MNRPNQGYSLEQARFQDKIKQASKIMDKIVVNEQKNRTKPEKTQFAQRLEQKNQMNFGEETNQFSPEVGNMRQRLGNVVT